MAETAQWQIEVRKQDRHLWDDLYKGQDLSSFDGYYGTRTFELPVALLLVDPYKDVFSPNGVKDQDAEGQSASLAVLQRVADAARAKGVPVCYSTNEYRAEAKSGRNVTHRSRGSDFDAAEAFAFCDQVSPVGGDFVVYKSRASAFFGTPLSTQLRLLGVQSLIVGGYTTSGCFRASAVDAYSNGFSVMVIEDGVGDRSPISQASTLFDLHHKYATVVHSDAVLKLIESL